MPRVSVGNYNNAQLFLQNIPAHSKLTQNFDFDFFMGAIHNSQGTESVQVMLANVEVGIPRTQDTYWFAVSKENQNLTKSQNPEQPNQKPGFKIFFFEFSV